MKIYLVGGAVRDQLLGLPVTERDWVVVGATEKEMLKQGYRQVGKEFPVFLHPKTGEEYALARMERKVKPGYKGFTFDTSPEVTLFDDLERRDLTINAMAKTLDGQLIDPYHGKQDLDQKILRHVSTAFAEDPVRILRVGRFLARYAHLGFKLAPETETLMQNMVAVGEVDALVAERVWKEFERALREKNPEKFFEVLNDCGALVVLFPDLDLKNDGLKALILAAKRNEPAIIRFAVLLHDFPGQKNIAELCNRYRVPNAYREIAKLTALHYREALNAKSLSAEELLTLFSSLDIFRREERFQLFLISCHIIAHTKDISFDSDWLFACAQASKAIDVKALIAEGFADRELATKLREKRIDKIREYLKKH